MIPRLLYGIDLREYKGVTKAAYSPWMVSAARQAFSRIIWITPDGMPRNGRCG